MTDANLQRDAARWRQYMADTREKYNDAVADNLQRGVDQRLAEKENTDGRQ